MSEYIRPARRRTGLARAARLAAGAGTVALVAFIGLTAPATAATGATAQWGQSVSIGVDDDEAGLQSAAPSGDRPTEVKAPIRVIAKSVRWQ